MGANISLTDEQIRRILLSEDSSRVLAKRMHITHPLVSRIRRGLVYVDRCLDLPRWPYNHILRNGKFIHKKSTCNQCIHYVSTWDPRHNGHVCALGIPEIKTIGSIFARDCPAFTPEPCLQPHPNTIGPRTIGDMPPVATGSNASMQYQPV